MKKNDLLLATLVMTIWGFNFSMIKMGITDVHPLLATAARFTLAVIPAIFFIRRPNVEWRYLAGYGVVFGVGVWGMASWSITAGLSSGMSSVLLSSNALISMAVGVFIQKEMASKRKVIGAVIALAALLVLISATNGNLTAEGVFLIMVAATSWTIMGLIVKASKTTQAFAFNVWGMLFAPIPLVLFAVSIYGPNIVVHAMEVWDMKTTFAVAFQAYPTTLFGYWVWSNLLIRYPLSTTAPLTLLVPVFALISGYFMYDEMLSTAQMIACVLFLIGIGFIVKPATSKSVLTPKPLTN
ncbi:putative Permease of the drug/metabolite transporter (DMT) superfamily [Vibrio nigripulchritudo SFn27]|uniref:Putative Permease of the drug/metabolite transporter (DMT) superfamily n=1 Tax=Vibrio nigripulchritudo TaxID=28173 RepID=U4KHF5_9VIBR|nr:EamA family transporter [Vibrio nigripulchritudo]CCN80324.1 putative Permease of the drug/metabolite transporter (DMT) superfamily [Vibrio nigripulchritudo BLFn1]CCN90364.1 putative Permease of the drug/metabolite transporter (DMT) superfamily [Vibrio nigripulchritudo SFn27]CCN97465.1 putative Permease of the drug/metabolite transporter (DMT) superfamily [Vibrio nigripulchritudo ENn2]CCO42890.1 putative Permease of the drug/metabolite transporter (DMT) superfamily [Vibrio nigripulchritudo SF